MLTQVMKLKCMNLVEQVLHVPGNYSGGILEMAIVFDGSLEKETVRGLTGDLIKALKSHSQVFRNVRLNTIIWKGSETLIKEVTPMPVLQMGRFFDSWETIKDEKSFDELARQLKLFYARSKLILVLTAGDFVISDEAATDRSMKPFLEKKIIFISEKPCETAKKLCRRVLELT